MVKKKKKIFYQSDFSLIKTGFARIAKTVLSYLYKTGKYDIVHYCAGTNVVAPELKKTPWKSIGCIPATQQEINEINRDPHIQRQANYGSYYLDRAIKEEKPDVYMGVQDIWGVDFSINKKWFNKISSVVWTTLDSLPILPSAIDAAPRVKNYWVWSSFAMKELHKLGHDHVKTMHGPLEHDKFHKLKDKARKELRKRHKIAEDIFVIGFVFRNQLRKSVPNLLEGYKLFKDKNPDAKSKLLFHTHFDEGWGIHKLAKESGVDKEDIIATHVCNRCFKYEIKNFAGQGKDCPLCGSEKSQETANVKTGISEEQLNEVYNMMDVYCHPFTSGGQEIPIQEAKLAELITLVTNYSCGEDMCVEEAHSLPLDWASYREPNTEFIKASTDPASICEQLTKVYNLSKKERKEWGKKARAWTIENYSIEKLGPVIEKFLDSLPFTDYAFQDKEEERDPRHQVPDIKDNGEWILYLYHNILKMRQVDKHDDGYKYWMGEIEKGTSREQIDQYFRKVATQENEKINKIELSDLLDKDDEGKRILFVIPESIGDVFMSTSLFESLKETYPDYNLYVSTEPVNFEILAANPYVHKVIPYTQQMDNLLLLEGAGGHKGYFEIAFLPHVGTQRILDYLHNGKDKITFNIKKENAHS